MKKTLLLTLIIYTASVFAQSRQNPPVLSPGKTLLVTPFGGVKPSSGFVISGDSLAGFNVDLIEQELLARGLSAKERFGYIEILKRNFIKQKYGLNSAPALSPAFTGKQTGGGGGVFTAPCVNEGFESTSPGTYSTASSVNGWTLSSGFTYTCIDASFSWTQGSPEFSIVATPISNVPNVGTIGQSPLGGTVVAQLNNHTANTSVTRITQTFPVTASNSLFRYAFAGYYEDGGTGHGCCEQPGFNVVVKSCTGSVSACVSQTWNAPASTCSTAALSFSYNSSTYTYWTNWQIKQIDLSPFIGSCVTIEIYSYDCAYGGHRGVTYFDSECANALASNLCSNCTYINNPSPVNFCPGGPAQIIAPQGYSSYLWIAPGGGTIIPNPASVLTITNPVAASVYTVYETTANGCMFVVTHTLATTQVSVTGLAARGTCTSGASGSATVLASGSGSGYTYIWTNSSSSVVSTSSVASNLTAGVYSVQLSAANNSSCGTSGATVMVNSNVVNTFISNRAYCGSAAYLSPGAGTNYQWYNNNSAISGTIGTASAYTVTSPSNGAVYRVSLTNPQGCRDSMIYILTPSSSPTLAITFNKLTCDGANNGMAVFSFNTLNQQSSGNTFSVLSTGTTPSYLSTNTVTAFNSYTATGLTGAGTYSIIAFDGSCYSSASFLVNTYYTANLYNLSPLGSTAICQGNSMFVNIAFTNTTNTNSQFTYTWMPNQFLAGNNNHLPSTLITPTAAVGNSAIYIYTVTISPTTAVCAVTRTMAVQVSNAGNPTVSSPGLICNSAGSATLTANPPGGVFSGNPPGAVSPAGILNPALANIGVNSFQYVYSVNNCSATATGNYTINQGPSLSVTGNTSICAGQSATLTASGAQVYFWPGLGVSAQVIVTPASTTSYVVTGSSGNNCTDSKMVTVNVTPFPNISLSGNMSICIGDSARITASGASTYNWSGGATGATAAFNPQSTTSYSVTGTNNPAGCSNGSAFTITVNPLPVIVVSGPTVACKGDLVTLTASGALTYVWDNVPSAFYSQTLFTSKSITVTGTDANGCSSSDVHIVMVEDCAGISVNSEGSAIRMYPNPAKDKIIMVLPAEGRLTIHDAAGKLILRSYVRKGDFSLDLSSYSAGLYSLELESGQNTYTTKLVKQE
jgi:hypothetical protein